jgi:hypothetical protein
MPDDDSIWQAEDALEQALREMHDDGILAVCQRCGSLVLPDALTYAGCPSCR